MQRHYSVGIEYQSQLVIAIAARIVGLVLELAWYVRGKTRLGGVTFSHGFQITVLSEPVESGFSATR